MVSRQIFQVFSHFLQVCLVRDCGIVGWSWCFKRWVFHDLSIIFVLLYTSQQWDDEVGKVSMLCTCCQPSKFCSCFQFLAIDLMHCVIACSSGNFICCLITWFLQWGLGLLTYIYFIYCFMLLIDLFDWFHLCGWLYSLMR